MVNINFGWDLNDPQYVLAVIRRLASQVTGRCDRSTLFSCIGTELKSSIHYDRLCINLYDADREFLTALSEPDGTASEMFSNTRIAQDTVAWQVIQSRKPVLIPDLSLMKSMGASSLASAGLVSTVAVPLLLNDKVVATLHASFRHAPDNLVQIQVFLTALGPVLAMMLFVVLTEEQEIRNKAMHRSGMHATSDYARLGRQEPDGRLLDTADMGQVMKLARKAARLRIPVLICGETGTGKSMMARWLHRNGDRQDAPFIKVNCPSLAPTLFESEMFGYAKGAFTGAVTNRIGRIEMASNGTLFLDEIGELTPDMQSKLLQVLEENCFERVGDATSIGVDIRIISATNIAVREAVASGRLRRDLFYRLSPIILNLPPLRQRRRDIPHLISYFLEDTARQWEMQAPHVPAAMMAKLCEYSWPGNLRELRNAVSRLLLLSLDGRMADISLSDVLNDWDIDKLGRSGEPGPDAMAAGRELRGMITAGSTATPDAGQGWPGAPRLSLAEEAPLPTLEENEREHILRALKQAGGRLGGARGAAALLGIPRTTLQHRMRKLGIGQEA